MQPLDYTFDVYFRINIASSCVNNYPKFIPFDVFSTYTIICTVNKEKIFSYITYSLNTKNIQKYTDIIQINYRVWIYYESIINSRQIETSNYNIQNLNTAHAYSSIEEKRIAQSTGNEQNNKRILFFTHNSRARKNG